ncbi:MAG TPA: nuclear transport factor 2 family protein [Nitrospiria bacterium]|jgi:ketosteroid isomerase-like protein|nr:nuclear transport factor 2 family protein [Nitrospiria bacterium]
MSSLENQEFEIEQANERFYRAFESLDIRQMESVWATDVPVRCVHPGWDLRSGWPEVRDSWVLVFNHTTGIRFNVTDVDIVVNGDLAWVTCTENVRMANDGESQQSRILATNLYLRRSKGWLMVLHHASPIFGGTAER